MKLWIASIIIGAGIVLLTFGVMRHRSQPAPATTQPELTQPSSAMVQKTNQFAFALFQELLHPQTQEQQRRPTIVQTPSSNKVFSPLGVQMVLSLFLNGAEGQTYQEIAQALGFQGVPLQEINQFHLSLQKRLQGWQAGGELVIANSVWHRPFDRLRADFARVGSLTG